MATMRELLSEIDPDRVSVGEVVYPPGGTLGPRRQDDVQLVLVHSGSARIAVDDEEPVTHDGGTVALLLPGHREHFSFATDEPTHHSWVQAHLRTVPDGLPPALPISPALADLVRAAVEANRAPLATARPLVAALAAAALLRYAGEAESGAGGPAGAVERARAFLHAHLADPEVDLPQAARAAHVSPPHLVRRFRAELGVTPMAYLWQRRVATGVDLLKHTGLPVGVIAARAGFKSVYHFSRRVKAATGLSPTQLRGERWR
jgi:AraC-like DNA-binding protein/quercetin dioxygenase-like cupin family protein